MFRNKALEGVRVLDLTNEMGVYAPKLFADLGAEVIRVIPPVGDTTAGLAPYIGEEKSNADSIPYQFFNTNKKSVCLDLEIEQGQEIFRQLTAKSQIVIETYPPGYLTSLGLGYKDLSIVHPQLVYTSITAFGQDGPYQHFQATPLIGLAMGGLLNLGGYPDSEPLAVCANQAYFAASLYAAVGTMFALLEAEWKQRGQFVDVSMQEAVALALENAAQFYDMEGVIRQRQGVFSQEAGMGLYPCQDGYIYLIASGLGLRSWQALMEWMQEVGEEGQPSVFAEERWQEQAYRRTEEAKKIFYKEFIKFSKRLKKEELYREGQKRKIPVCPVNTPEDIAQSIQLAARNYFQSIYHPQLQKEIRLLGAPYLLSATPWQLEQAAPLPGTDTKAVLEELGYTVREISELEQEGVIRCN